MDDTVQPNTPVAPSASASTPPVEPIQPVQPPNSPKKLILMGLAGFVLALLICGGAWYLTSNRQTAYDSKQTAAATSPSPEPTVDPTADWRQITMTNWQLKVPSEWRYMECDEDTQFFGEEFDTDRDNADCGFDGLPGNVSIYKSEQELQIPVTYKDNDTESLVTEKTEIKVDGINAIRQKQKYTGGQGEGTYISVYIPEAKVVITLDDITKEEIFDHIVSSFKFTNSPRGIKSSPSPTDSMSNWKTYNDVNYPFSIQHPPTWNLTTTYGKSVGKTDQDTVAGIDVRTAYSSTYGSTVVVHIIDPKGKTFKDWVASRFWQGGSTTPPSPNYSYKGNTAYKTTYERPGKTDGVNIYYMYKDKVIWESWNGNESEQETIDKILSTLKFSS